MIIQSLTFTDILNTYNIHQGFNPGRTLHHRRDFCYIVPSKLLECALWVRNYSTQRAQIFYY